MNEVGYLRGLGLDSLLILRESRRLETLARSTSCWRNVHVAVADDVPRFIGPYLPARKRSARSVTTP
jgi:hypothetical protein